MPSTRGTSGPRSHEPGLRSLLAGNAGPFTLDGTRTYVIGTRRVAVIDPGPDTTSHVAALARMVVDAESVTIVVTHEHDDHAGAAFPLAKLTEGRVVGLTPGAEPLADGAVVSTDAGELVAIDTPGHAAEHLCFHWPAQRALFAGDLVIGAGDTTWVAGYPGAVRNYLASLDRLKTLALLRIYPAHGDPIDDVPERLARFESHRRKRIDQVAVVLQENPTATRREIFERVYGDSVPQGLERAAIASMDAILDYLGERERP